MKKQNQKTTNLPVALLALGLSLAATGVQAQHINAGAINQNPGGQLQFVGAGAFVLSSGFQQLPNVISLNYSNSGTFAGLFNGSSPTFTALAFSNAPAFSAAPGSHLDLSIVSATGPAGGSFYFFDHDATTPTYTLGVGGTATTDLLDLSQNTGLAGQDPFGHIHGRRFGVDLAGTYSVGFQILDTTGYHSASDVYYLTYTTNPVPEPSATALALGGLAAAGWISKRARNKPVK